MNKSNQSIHSYFLEDSNHPHFTNNKVEEIQTLHTGNTKVLKASGESVLIEHGEHHTVATYPDTKFIIKIRQQEFNPITKLMQDSAD